MNCVNGLWICPRYLYSNRTWSPLPPVASTQVGHLIIHSALLGTHTFIEFEIALELDSAEVRGLLLNNGQEAGR